MESRRVIILVTTWHSSMSFSSKKTVTHTNCWFHFTYIINLLLRNSLQFPKFYFVCDWMLTFKQHHLTMFVLAGEKGFFCHNKIQKQIFFANATFKLSDAANTYSSLLQLNKHFIEFITSLWSFASIAPLRIFLSANKFSLLFPLICMSIAVLLYVDLIKFYW